MPFEFLAAAFAFLAVTSLALSIFQVSPAASVVEQRLRGFSKAPSDSAQVAGGMLKRDVSSLALLRTLSASTWGDKSLLDLQRAGSSLKVSEYILVRFLMAIIAGIVCALVFRGSSFAIFLIALGALAGYMMPRAYISTRKGRRLAALNAQLVEMLQLVSNALRSGFAFTQAVELAARQLEPPVQTELNHFLRDINLGARHEDALKALADRTGSYDMQMLVTTLLVQRTTGGNLSEILDNVADTIRERERLQAEIRALTAQQRVTGTILSVYPIALGLMFVALAPDLMSVLWKTDTGLALLGIAASLQVIGILSIRQVLRLDV